MAYRLPWAFDKETGDTHVRQVSWNYTGALLMLGLSYHTNFLFIAIPGVIAAAAIFLMHLNAAVESKKSSVTPVTLDIPIAT